MQALLQGLQSANAALKAPKDTAPQQSGGGGSDGAAAAVDVSETTDVPKSAPTGGSGKKGGGAVVGIDLGTTYSCVAVCMPGAGRVEVLQNSDGSRTTPSWVAFSKQDGTRLVGQGAKNQAAANPQNTVNDAKRLIGRSFHDSGLQADLKHFAYKVRIPSHSYALLRIPTHSYALLRTGPGCAPLGGSRARPPLHPLTPGRPDGAGEMVEHRRTAAPPAACRRAGRAGCAGRVLRACHDVSLWRELSCVHATM